MTLSEARGAAAAAIRAAASGVEVPRVVEVDTVTENDIPMLADGLWDAPTATSSDRGPAVVAVMARARQASQAIELIAFTVIKSRLALELEMAGKGRGLATLDLIESALSHLPGHGLPRLLVETMPEPLSPPSRDENATIYVYSTRCVWPPAFPGEPTGQPIDADDIDGISAIRDHVADAVEAAGEFVTAADVVADPSLADRREADLARIGDTEARQRVATIDGLVPRCAIELSTYREAIGGAPDLTVIDTQTFTGADGREWSARGATQRIVVTVTVRHRTKRLADALVTAIAAALDDTEVVWPGAFDAREVSGSDIVTNRLSDGTFRSEVLLLMRDPAAWDLESGLAVASIQASVQLVTLLAPATQSVPVTDVEVTGSLLIPPA